MKRLHKAYLNIVGNDKNGKWKFLIYIVTMLIVISYIFINAKCELIIEDDVLIGLKNWTIERKESIKHILVPSGVRGIGKYAFDGCYGLESIELSDTVEDIGNFAFNNCKSLKTIVIPNSVKNIGGGAFSTCKGLKSIQMPDDLETLGSFAFSDCTELETVDIPKGIKIVGSSTFENCVKLKEVKLPEGIEEIGDEAFLSCKELSVLKLSNGIKKIGTSAFGNCIKLQSVDIPDTVEHIKDSAFYNCLSLSNIQMSEGIKYVGNKAFEDTKYYNEQLLSKNEYIYIGKVLIKHKNIKTRVKLEDGVRVISDEAFIDNNILLSIDLPKSLICIGKRAFKNCVNLKEVNLPEYLENIEDEAFNKSKIKSIEIPKSVRNIGYAAFKDCVELDEVKLQDTPDTVGAAAFKNTGWIMDIKLDEYRCRYSQNILFEYFGREKFIKVKEGTKVIAGGVFRSSEELEKVEFPKSLEYIGYSSFEYCENLKQIIFEEDCNLKVLDTKAFEGCVSLESPVLPSKLEEVEDLAFGGCEKIEKIRFPESVKHISNYALSTCVNLKIIELPKSMEGKYKFESIDIYQTKPEMVFY